jgi:hypothetical protein
MFTEINICPTIGSSMLRHDGIAPESMRTLQDSVNESSGWVPLTDDQLKNWSTNMVATSIALLPKTKQDEIKMMRRKLKNRMSAKKSVANKRMKTRDYLSTMKPMLDSLMIAHTNIHGLHAHIRKLHALSPPSLDLLAEYHHQCILLDPVSEYEREYEEHEANQLKMENASTNPDTPPSSA